MNTDEIELIVPTEQYAEQIEDYRAEFPAERMRVTLDPERIPGLDYLEDYDSVTDWLRFCESVSGKITWYMSVRKSDGKIIGFCCLRHKLEYDDDDIEFASHVGYSVRPDEQGKGYAKRQLRLLMLRAKELGLDRLRLVCRDINEASARTILACGGRYIDSIYGDESGITINRYDIQL